MYLLQESHVYYKQEHLAPYFPVRIELVCEMNTSCNLCVSFWRWALFAPKSPIQMSWRNTYLTVKKKTYNSEAGASSTLFSFEKWESFWRQCFLNVRCFNVELACFAPSRAIQMTWGNTCFLKRKPSVVEGAASSTLFPCENSLKEYILQIILFMVKITSFCPKYTYSTQLKKYV
jgi:hypothetical protein